MAASLCSTAFKTNACWNSFQSPLTTHRNRHRNKTKPFEFGIWVRNHRKFSCKYLKNNLFSDIIRVPFNRGRGSAPLIDALTNWDVGAPLRGAFRLYLVYKSHGCQVEQTKTCQVKGQRFHFQLTDISSSYKFSHDDKPHALCPAADLLARGSNELLPCVEVLNGAETAAYTWSPALYRQSQGYQNTDWHQRAGLLSTNWNETMLSWSAVGLPVSNRYHYRKVHYYLKKTAVLAIYWRPLE